MEVRYAITTVTPLFGVLLEQLKYQTASKIRLIRADFFVIEAASALDSEPDLNLTIEGSGYALPPFWWTFFRRIFSRYIHQTVGAPGVEKYFKHPAEVRLIWSSLCSHFALTQLQSSLMVPRNYTKYYRGLGVTRLS